MGGSTNLNQKNTPLKLDFEKYVKNFLIKMGFKDVCGGSSFKIGGAQVDAVAGWEDTLLIIECKTKENYGPSYSINTFIDSLKGRADAIFNDLKKRGEFDLEGRFYDYTHYKKYKLILATNNIEIKRKNIEYANEGYNKVYIWHDKFLEYYSNLIESVGPYTKFQLLGEMRINPRNNDIISVPALKTVINDITLYNFVINPQRLLEVACVARRERGKEEYYQRMLDGSRLEKIREYLGAHYTTCKNPICRKRLFPNNIIVAFFPEDQFRCPEFKRIDQNNFSEEYNYIPDCEFGILTFPKKYRACWIIDGQHRLFSFANVEDIYLGHISKQRIVVTAFRDLPIPDQRRYFLDINEEQKSVSKDLIWDIIADSEPKSEKGIIANTIRILGNYEPFKNRIYVPSKGIKRRGQFSLNSLCMAIDKTKLTEMHTQHYEGGQPNIFYNKKDKINISKYLATALSEYFCFLDNFFDKELLGFFTKDIGWVTIGIYLYERIISKSTKKPDNNTLIKYFTIIKDYINDRYNDKENYNHLRGMSSGEGNKSKIVKEFLIQIRDNSNDKNFDWLDLEELNNSELQDRISALESLFRKLIKNTFDKIDRKWYKNSNYLKEQNYERHKSRLHSEMIKNSDLKEEDIWSYLDFGSISEIIEKHDKKFRNVFRKEYSDYNFVVSLIKLINRVRGPITHAREINPPSEREIRDVKNNLPVLIRIIEEYLKTE